jgi:hypothetical protein
MKIMQHLFLSLLFLHIIIYGDHTPNLLKEADEILAGLSADQEDCFIKVFEHWLIRAYVIYELRQDPQIKLPAWHQAQIEALYSDDVIKQCLECETLTDLEKIIVLSKLSTFVYDKIYPIQKCDYNIFTEEPETGKTEFAKAIKGELSKRLPDLRTKTK